MYLHYFLWQYYFAPRWLLLTAWNIQRAIWQYFSVGIMLRTLFSHWHRDRVSYRQGSIAGMLHAWAWNAISRVVGFFVRACVLCIWLFIQLLFLTSAAIALAIFLLWPVLVVITFAWGLLLIVSS